MRATRNDVVLHFIIGAIVLVVSILFFFVKIDLKVKPVLFQFGGHFSVVGLIAAIVAFVFLVLSAFGIIVYNKEKQNDIKKIANRD